MFCTDCQIAGLCLITELLSQSRLWSSAMVWFWKACCYSSRAYWDISAASSTTFVVEWGWHVLPYSWQFNTLCYMPGWLIYDQASIEELFIVKCWKSCGDWRGRKYGYMADRCSRLSFSEIVSFCKINYCHRRDHKVIVSYEYWRLLFPYFPF